MTRGVVITFVCLAVAGFFGAKVLAGSRLGGIGLPTVTLSTPVTTQAVTVPIGTTVTTSIATVTTPTATVTVPTGSTVTTPAATVPVTVPSTTVGVTTSVATVTASGPSVPVTTSAPTVATSTTTSTTTGRLPVAVPETRPSAASTATAQEPRAHPKAGTGAAASGFLGTPDGGSVAATSVLIDPSRADETSAVIHAPGRGKPTVFLKRLGVQRLPGRAKRFVVQLRFILSGPAEVRFSVFGPAPSCDLAGRFTIEGHAGLNKVAFRRRIRGRLLPAGIYTIVPQATARAPRLSGTRVAIMIDARGVHPATPVPWENCRAATTTDLLPPVPPRYAGVAGAIATETPADTPAIRADRSVNQPSEFKAWILPSTGQTWVTIGILMSLLASAMLLGLAALKPLYSGARFGLVRGLDAHRGQVAFSGAAFLVAAGMLFLFSWLPS
jgi:hypothetical protein